MEGAEHGAIIHLVGGHVECLHTLCVDDMLVRVALPRHSVEELRVAGCAFVPVPVDALYLVWGRFAAGGVAQARAQRDGRFVARGRAQVLAPARAHARVRIFLARD